MVQLILAILIASLVSPKVIVLALVFYLLGKLIKSSGLILFFTLVLAAFVGPLVVMAVLAVYGLLKVLRWLDVPV